MIQSKIILDMSRYQMQVDFNLLKSKGQDYVMLKAASGNGTKDSKFEQHYEEATAAGILVSPYFWVDPIYSSTRQAQFFLDSIQGKNVGYIVLDFEHWWGDWQKWSLWIQGKIPGSEVPRIPANNLLIHFKAVYDYIAARTDLKIVVYTATWFLDSYCSGGYEFLKDKFTHWANYSLFNTKGVSTTWEVLETLVPETTMIPGLPLWYPRSSVVLWQFSGDKFSAPGVWRNDYRTGLSALDLNKWVNSYMTIEQFCNISEQPPIVEPPVVEPPLPESKTLWRVIATSGLNIRASATVLSGKRGFLKYDTVVEITSYDNGWGKLYGRDGYISMDWVEEVVDTPITKWIVTATLGLNVRETPSVSASKVGLPLPYNSQVSISEIISGGYNWGKLVGREGWISLNYARKI